MSREERKLRKHIEEHEKNLNRKSRKLAAKMRRAARQPTPRPRLDLRAVDREESEDDPVPVFDRRDRRSKESPSRQGQVIAIHPGSCKVLCGAQQVNCRLLPDLAVGDRVLVSVTGRRLERVQEVLPRTTTLSRPDPHNPRLERVIAANIEVVVIVASVRSPALRPGLIDRYLIAIERSGAEPVLCVNKMDLVDSEADLAALDPYRSLGPRLFLCSAATGQGISGLMEALAGSLCVLVGHSGVGKSSLLNAIRPELGLAARAVRESGGQGRHTTTSSTLYQIPNGPRIIDTPGIREFGLWQLSREELHRYFQEFLACAAACAFSDCTHTHEPACAVKQSVDNGAIPAARYRAYRRILESLE
ncbi:MAG: ribosome small subunit-dependent GTPase A [Acidobacteria bacterium]|nr:ribosome small subunit-dependent GTPase A [Acidobacteriota bacterium]